MVFPVALSTISLDATAVQSLKLPELPFKLLEVGKVLNVRVGENPTGGEPGLYLLNQFVQAKLPNGVQKGDQLQVQVLQNAETLLLKVLAAEPAVESDLAIPAPAPRVDQTLRSALTETQLTDLKQLVRSIVTQGGGTPGQNVLKLDTLPAPVAEIVKKLAQGQALLTDEQLAHPEVTEHTIGRVLTDSIVAKLSEAKREVAALQRGSLSPAERELVRALDRLFAGSASDRAGAPTFGFSAPVPANPFDAHVPSPQRLDVFRALSRLVTALAPHGASVDPTVRGLLAASREQKELGGFLAQSLSQLFKFFESAGVEPDGDLLRVLRDLDAQLAKARDFRLVESESQELPAKTRAALRGKFPGALDAEGGPERVKVEEGLKASLGRLMQGQEALDVLKPVLNALGEPAMSVVPALIGGQLMTWQVQTPPPEIENEKDGGAGSHAQEAFERVTLQLQFPGIGPVEVQLAHKTEHVMVRFMCRDETTVSHLQRFGHLLEASLGSVGFRRHEVSFAVAEQQTPVPDWCVDLVKSGVVA